MHKKILYIIIGICILGILFVTHVYISIGFGGYRGFLSQFQSLPNETKLEKLRSDVRNQISSEHGQLSSLEGLTFYEKTFTDMCAEGVHNWKSSDTFSNVCAYQIVHYYGISDNYENVVFMLENKLILSGWELLKQNPPQKRISEIMRQDKDRMLGADFPVYTKRVNNMNLFLRMNNFPGYFSGWKSLEKEPFPISVSRHQILFENQTPISPNDIIQKIESSGQSPLFIVISETYFRN